MESLDFLIVHDIVMSETAQLADIVLPAAIGIESTYSHAYIWAGLPLLAVSQKIFEPAGECWNDSMFWLELGKKMGYTDFFPWKDSDEMIEKEVLAPYGKNLKDMEASPGGFFYAGKTERVHEKEGFKTPSGKVELYSVMLEEMGLPPLPIPYEEPLESPISTPDLFKEYPLIGISGIRKEIYEQSTGRNLPSFRRRAPDPEIEIHPKDAEKNNIKNGEWVIIESPRGRVTMKARVTEDIKEGVVSMPHGWGGDGNVNRLTNDEVLDPITAASVSRGFACRVRRID
jgi:anaerobic selenocysteine-containing dehydrogenase